MTRPRVALAVAAAGIAARLGHLAAVRDHPYWEMWKAWPNSDMYQFAAWARHLASGDWLDAQSFRPYFDWQQAVAAPEVWNSWYGAGVYYQPPLYPYLAAGFFALTGGFDLMRVAQLVLGGINCGLIALLAAVLYGLRAGWIAGLCAALYAPFIVYDGELLRGTVVMTTQLLLLLALARAGSAWDEGGRGRRGALAGLAFGVAWLADPSILFLLPAALLWLIWTLRRGVGGGVALRPLVFFGVGAALSLLPLMGRNLAVGAPLLSITTRGPIAFVMGNAPDARPAGAYIPESTGPILRESGYRMGSTIAATFRRYEGDYGRLVDKQVEKLRALWGSYEIPDNPSIYYAARVSPVVRFGLRFLPIACLGLVGLFLAIIAARRDRHQALVPLFIASTMALFGFAHVVSRYRQPMAMGLIVLGAGAVSMALGRRGAAPIFLAATATVASFVLPWRPPEGYAWNRPAEFVVVARLHAERGDLAAAVGELREALELADQEAAIRHMKPALHFEMGSIQAKAGRHREAAEAFREVLRLEPGFEGAAEALHDAEAAAPPGRL